MSGSPDQHINKSTNHRMIRESCVETLAEALKAEESGSDRVELCDNLMVGGTTPSYGTIITCKKYLKIPIKVMIRPRGGNFVYSPQEIESMIRDIWVCRDAGVQGIVTGVMTPDRRIDMAVLQRLVREAGSLRITFHKAIDESQDICREILRLRDSGIHSVLSSGGASSAREGAPKLNEMISLAAGKLIIIAAGKVTASNLAALGGLIHTDEFHGRKIMIDLNSGI